VTSVPGFPKLGRCRHADRRNADKQVAAIRFVPLTGDQLFELQRAAEPANRLLSRLSPIRQLLLGRPIAIEQIEQQNTFGHGQRAFGQTSGWGVVVHRREPHDGREQRLQHLGIRRQQDNPP
jgi:hypothetical protein